MSSGDDAAVAERRRAVVVAGHRGGVDVARDALTDLAPEVRSAALGALDRLGELNDEDVTAALCDPSTGVRRRAAEIASSHPGVDLARALDDDDPRVVEVAAWACGEHESDRSEIVSKLLALGADADDPLVRESAVAALGAIGDVCAIDVIIGATSDKPAIRRRAVLALAPFVGDPALADRVDATIERALGDRDWQVRQAAEDLRRITSA